MVVSALYEKGLDELKDEIYQDVFSGEISLNNEKIITNIRHKEALEKAKESLLNSIESIKNNMSEEFISVDLRRALNYLGEIVGEVTTEDVLNDIFKNFCIGK